MLALKAAFSARFQGGSGGGGGGGGRGGSSSSSSSSDDDNKPNRGNLSTSTSTSTSGGDGYISSNRGLPEPLAASDLSREVSQPSEPSEPNQLSEPKQPSESPSPGQRPVLVPVPEPVEPVEPVTAVTPIPVPVPGAPVTDSPTGGSDPGSPGSSGSSGPGPAVAPPLLGPDPDPHPDAAYSYTAALTEAFPSLPDHLQQQQQLPPSDDIPSPAASDGRDKARTLSVSSSTSSTATATTVVSRATSTSTSSASSSTSAITSPSTPTRRRSSIPAQKPPATPASGAAPSPTAGRSTPPRSRRTCGPLANRSCPEVHAARVAKSRSATLSAGSPLPTHKHSSSSPASRDNRPKKVSRRSLNSNASTESAPEQQVLSKMDSKWVTVQQKTFTKWLNTKIIVRGLEVKDLVADLSDGVLLIHLLECLSQESLGRYAAKPKMRVQRFENANIALDFVKSRGIQMTNIGAEDVVDGNRKIILGLIWTLILRFTINDINEEGMTAKEGLLLWCQRKTACYDEVEVRDFSTSWNDGLAFCALLDIHRPDLIDYDALDKSDHRGNMQLAFDIANKEIGIPSLLDVEDVCDVNKPDERSLMTYIAYWFHAFSQMEKVENAGRRVEKFVNNMQGAWEMQSAYERRMAELLKQIREQMEQWLHATFEGTYVDAKRQATDFAAYKRGKKRDWVAEKSELATLLGNIKTKMATYRLRAYEPPPELGLDALDREWTNLTKSEMMRGQLINETIRDIKNALRKSFADKANDFALALNTMQVAISGLEGDVEDQLLHVRRLSDNLPPLDAYLKTIEAVDEKCQEANIEENDFTTYTYDELLYELGLVKSAVSKKLAFLENQLVARDMTNLTPIQLEEFESVFRHFDRDDSNSLSELEFSAALASLGLVFSEDEMHDYFLDTSRGHDRVSFEQFIRFMVDVTEDQNTAEQVFQSFREVADGKPYVTEMDLRHSLVPDEVIEKLIEIIPEHSGPDMAQDRGQAQYDYMSFMEKLMSSQRGDTALGDVLNGQDTSSKTTNGTE